MQKKYDVAVVGSGPNGLAAAITLAKAGASVIMYEAKSTVGGGMRSAELTQGGFVHDICSAVHPLGKASPFFSKLDLHKYGLEWIEPKAPLAHPLDDEVVILERSLDQMQIEKSYKSLMNQDWQALSSDILGPLLRIPSHPFKLLRFGYYAIQSAEGLLKRKFNDERTKALFAGLAAHSTLPLNRRLTASYGLVLGLLAHTVGWPIAKGGSQNIANALASYFKQLSGTIVTDAAIEHLDQLQAKTVLFDLTPKQVAKICGLTCRYQYGPGVFKIDWALHNPIPWKHKRCLEAATVHIGGTWQEIAASEKAVWEGKIAKRNFILLCQPTLFDPTRAPFGKHTAWAYCHVPNGSTVDLTDAIEEQIERVAPGFKECIIARATKNCDQLEEYNANYIGGDIAGGVQDVFQRVSYRTKLPGVYICSSSTAPGGGVHGMCGYWAAKEVMKDGFKEIRNYRV